VDAGIVLKCSNLSKIEQILGNNKMDDNFKIYVNDIGMLVAMFNDKNISKLILNNTVSGDVGGAIYENLIAIMLKQNGFDLFYYAKPADFEVDFIIKNISKIYAIEVKKNRGTTKSLNYICNQNTNLFPIRFKNSNLGTTNEILTLPHYLAIFLNLLE
jgi:predicted AAA+ superfamily ATPase